MSEFTLPANSKVGEGKHWALPRPAQHVKSFRIYRWDPAENANPPMDTFDIDRDHCGISPAASSLRFSIAFAGDCLVSARNTRLNWRGLRRTAISPTRTTITSTSRETA